jgi:methylated-DNA-[protein]-cysteine S-methyltransferase
VLSCFCRKVGGFSRGPNVSPNVIEPLSMPLGQSESEMRLYEVLSAPWGSVTVVLTPDGRLCEVATCDRSAELEQQGCRPLPERSVAGTQLAQYFDGTLREFDLPLALNGLPFQMRVWALLTNIPYGQTRTYGDLARVVGGANYSRAVGSAVGANPIAIVVPCHRVLGASGALTGYAGGIDVKRSLLDIESRCLGGLFG